LTAIPVGSLREPVSESQLGNTGVTAWSTTAAGLAVSLFN
jgi:hypothetical protein